MDHWDVKAVERSIKVEFEYGKSPYQVLCAHRALSVLE